MNPKTTWNLEILKKNKKLENIHKEILEFSNKFIEKWEKRTDWLEDPNVLLEALEEYNLWQERYGLYEDEFLYYYLHKALEESNSEIKAKYNKIYAEAIDLYNRIQFFTIKLSTIDYEAQKKLLSSKSLTEYKHFLESLFRGGKHVLSEAEEKILNVQSKVSHSNWVQMLSGILSKEERKVLNEDGKKENRNFSDILELLSDHKKEVRDDAAKVFNRILEDHLDVAENEINSVLENKYNLDKLKKFERPDETRFISDDIDSTTVDLLLKTVTANFQISRDFYKFKAEVLGLKKLEYHERNLEVSEVKRKYSFDEGYNIVKKSFKSLDKEFEEIFSRLFANSQVDVFTKKGKKSGAFAMTNRIDQPSFVFLNYTESLNDLLTMAHEFGHAINFELSKKQKALNFDFPMCTAETSSTFCEDFVLKEVLTGADDELRLAIQMSKLNSDISTIFRQVAFYNFETELHSEFRSKGYLSHSEIGAIFQKHMKDYMGEYVEQNPGSENWWVYISHFRSFFYVYSYAFGLLVSKILQSNVKKDINFMVNVKDFFSNGRFTSPKDMLSSIGVNITEKETWLKGINEIKILLEETKELHKKIKRA